MSNTHEHRTTIENLILDGTVQTLFSENKTKTPFSEVKCLLPSIKKIFEEIFCMQAELFKTKFNLMSLSFCAIRISSPHQLIFESEFLGVCAFKTQLWQIYA